MPKAIRQKAIIQRGSFWATRFLEFTESTDVDVIVWIEENAQSSPE